LFMASWCGSGARVSMRFTARASKAPQCHVCKLSSHRLHKHVDRVCVGWLTGFTKAGWTAATKGHTMKTIETYRQQYRALRNRACSAHGFSVAEADSHAENYAQEECYRRGPSIVNGPSARQVDSAISPVDRISAMRDVLTLGAYQ
jgi:hypothetical protein